MLQTSLRVRCRNQRCRCKLPIPTENDHKAFCSPYCYNQFFHWKCAVCEVEILRGKRRKQPKCCRSPKCNKTYKNFTPTYTFGYHPSLGAISASEVPLSQGAKGVSGATYQIVAGPPLSPSALWAATLPHDAATQARIDRTNRECQGHHIIKPGGHPINIVGGYKFLQAVKLDAGLRPVDKSDWRIQYQPGDIATEWTARELARRETEQQGSQVENAETESAETYEDLSIPAFLRREAA